MKQVQSQKSLGEAGGGTEEGGCGCLPRSHSDGTSMLFVPAPQVSSSQASLSPSRLSVFLPDSSISLCIMEGRGVSHFSVFSVSGTCYILSG